MEDNKADLRMRGSTVVDVTGPAGTIHPFSSARKSFFSVLSREIHDVISEKQGKKIAGYIVANMLCTVILLIWCNSTNSMALTAYTYLTIYDVFSLLTCLVTLWVQKQKPSPIFSFGYERFEVLAVFASTILAQLGAFFIIKESFERIIEQPEVHEGRLLVGTMLAFLFHMIVTYSTDNKAFNHVVLASSSSWLQEHMADMSESLCHLIPGLSKLLLPRINPFALIAFAGGTALIIVYILIDINNYFASDTWAAISIAMMTCGTMFPLSVYSGKILLQTTPSHIIGQLDKVLREASTLDGVLEFRHEHFWTLAFGTMGGSVHVRVRRDADAQLVLAHVVNRLSNVISVLTIQIFKDDWTRASAYQIINDTSLMAKMTPAGIANNPLRPSMDLNKMTKSPPRSPPALPYPDIIPTPWVPTAPQAGASLGRLPYGAPTRTFTSSVGNIAPSTARPSAGDSNVPYSSPAMEVLNSRTPGPTLGLSAYNLNGAMAASKTSPPHIQMGYSSPTK